MTNATRNDATTTARNEIFVDTMKMDTWATNGSTRPSKAARRAKVQKRKFVRNNG